MASLIASCISGDVSAEAVLVVSPKAATPAAIRATSLGVPVTVIAKGEAHDEQLSQALSSAGVDIICLAGYMFLLPPDIVQRYEGRVLNIHPALLPKYGGKGMYGRRVHEAVLAAGETESGCTVHLVNDRYDEGEIILQKRCPVLDDDTVETLAERVLDLEHVAFSEALKELATRVEA